MKKVLFIMLVALLSIATATGKRKPDFTAQDYANYNIDDLDGVADGKADFIAAALNIKSNFGLDKQGFIGQTTVIDCPGMNKQDIYVQAKLWMETFCAGDKRAELRLDGNQGSTLIARKRLIDVAGGDFKKTYGIKKKHVYGCKINLLVNIRVDVKDEKCRLITTIEDYGIEMPTNTGGAWGMALATGGIGSIIGAAIGSTVASALNTEKSMMPSGYFPFLEKKPFRPQKEGESEEKYLRLKEKYDKDWEKQVSESTMEAIAYISSFLITQIVHDKMVSAVTSAPSYGDNSGW